MGKMLITYLDEVVKDKKDYNELVEQFHKNCHTYDKAKKGEELITSLDEVRYYFAYQVKPPCVLETKYKGKRLVIFNFELASEERLFVAIDVNEHSDTDKLTKLLEFSNATATNVFNANFCKLLYYVKPDVKRFYADDGECIEKTVNNYIVDVRHGFETKNLFEIKQ